MTIGSKPFTSKPCSSNAQQTTKDNCQAKQRAEDFEKIEASRKKNELTILRNSSLQQFTEDAKKPLEFVFELSDEEAKQLLAMANMDAMAKKSGYEGFSQLKAATWSSEVIGLINHSESVPFAINMKKYLNAISAINTLQESAKEIEYKEPEGIRLYKDYESFNEYQERLNELNLLLLNSEKNIDNYATTLKNKLLQLDVNECYCMAGGWRGKSGHAMVYRFKKIEDGKFNIYIYNAQSGSETMQGGECIQGQIKSKPCYCFKDVTCAELFFAEQKDAEINGNPIILKRLIELRLDNITTSSKKYSIKDVLNLLSRFGARLTPTKKLPELYLSVQRSGNCSFKSINCLLLEIMSDGKEGEAFIESIKDYKRLMLNARFLSLLAFYDKYKKDFNKPTHLQHNYMLGRAVEDYLKILQKNLNRKTISQDEYNRVVATFHDLLCKLRAAAETAHNTYTNTKEEITAGQIEQLVIQEQKANRNKKIVELSQLTQPKLQDKVSFSLNANLGDITSWDKLYEELKKLKDILDKAEKSSCYQSVISQFEITIGKLFSNLNTVENLESKDIARSNQEALCNCLDI